MNEGEDTNKGVPELDGHTGTTGTGSSPRGLRRSASDLREKGLARNHRKSSVTGTTTVGAVFSASSPIVKKGLSGASGVRNRNSIVGASSSTSRPIVKGGLRDSRRSSTSSSNRLGNSITSVSSSLSRPSVKRGLRKTSMPNRNTGVVVDEEDIDVHPFEVLVPEEHLLGLEEDERLQADNGTPDDDQTLTNSSGVINAPCTPLAPFVGSEEGIQTEAQEHPPQQQEHIQKSSWRRRGLCLLVAVCLSGLILALALIYAQPDDDAGNDSGNDVLLLLNLPNSTLANMLEPNSPQSKAFAWLLNHPNLQHIDEWRRKQLFSLATFYYAFDGESWGNGFSYNRSECDWFSSMFIPFWSYYWSSECNPVGEFRTLWLQDIDLSKGSKTIPGEIALLTSLEEIVLRNLTLSGSIQNFIPSELLGLVTGLPDQLVQASSNTSSQLSGPAASDESANLRIFNVSGNNLIGTMPEQLCFLSAPSCMLKDGSLCALGFDCSTNLCGCDCPC